MCAVHKWRPYIIGRPFNIRTDHQSLKYLLEQRISTPAQQKWLSKLLGYDYVVSYKKGSENLVADALSRVPMEHHGELQTISMVHDSFLGKIKGSYGSDPALDTKIKACKDDPTSPSNYSWNGEFLLRKGNVVIGKDPILRKDLLLHFHDSALGGHSGIQTTMRRIAQTFYWKGMKKDIYTHTQECLVCQKNKGETVASPGLLQPIPIPERVWTEISMDFIVGLPNSHGKTTILVVVDRLSKAAHFIALKHPYTSSDIAQIFLDNVYKLHDFPKSIITDRDPIFLSSFWSEFFKLQNVHLHHSTAYHPQTDGQTEVVNRSLECYLRCFAGDRLKEWSSWLPLAEWWYNTSYQLSSNPLPMK